MDERLRTVARQLTAQVRMRMKEQFERLRIPLAKLEAARRHPDVWNYAHPDSLATVSAGMSMRTRSSSVNSLPTLCWSSLSNWRQPQPLRGF